MANSVIIIFLLIILRLSELRRLRRMQDYWQQTKFFHEILGQKLMA